MRFKVGYQVGSQEEVYIDIPDQTPGHMVFVGQTGCGKTTSLEAFVSQLVNQNKTVIVFRTQADEVGFMQSATSLDPYFGLPPEGVTGKFLQATIEAHIGKSAARHHGDLVDLTYPNRPASLKDVLLEVR